MNLDALADGGPRIAAEVPEVELRHAPRAGVEAARRWELSDGRVFGLVRHLFELDLARVNAVMPYIGYMWFWTDADHDRAQARVDETQGLLCELIVAASATPPAPERSRLLALRVLGAYVIGLRDLRYGRATLEQSVRSVVAYVLD